MNELADWECAVLTTSIPLFISLIVFGPSQTLFNRANWQFILRWLEPVYFLCSQISFLMALITQAVSILLEHRLHFNLVVKDEILMVACWLILKFLNRPKKPRLPKKQPAKPQSSIVRIHGIPAFKPT